MLKDDTSNIFEILLRSTTSSSKTNTEMINTTTKDL